MIIKTKIFCIPLFFLSVIIASCNRQNADNRRLFSNNYEKVFDDKIFIRKKINLECSIDCIISFPYDICSLNNKLFIASRGTEIKVFNIDGKFLYKVGKIGDGPGEYRNINCIFAVQNNKVGIFDSNNSRITIYNEKGDYLYSKEIKIPEVYSFRRIVNYKNSFFLQVPYSEKYPFYLIELDSNLTIKRGYLEASDDYKAYAYRGLFNGGIFLNFSKGLLYEINTYSNNVVKKLNIILNSVSDINLGHPDFFRAVPQLKGVQNYAETKKHYNMGTDIYNMYLIKDRFLILQYLVHENDITILKTMLYDLITYKTYLIEGRIAPTYSDGRYLYEIKFLDSSEIDKNTSFKNPILIFYAINEEAL